MKKITLLGVLTLLVTAFLLPDSIQSFVLDKKLAQLKKVSAEQKVEICSRDNEQLELTNTPKHYRVGLQVGHMDATQLPDELAVLRSNTGAKGGGKIEWEVNYAVAVRTAELLRTQGITVDILPATIPSGYKADAFITIHADQNPNTSLTGFKSISSGYETSGKSDDLSIAIHREYLKSTCMKLDRALTSNMKYYYAFNWKKFEYSIHFKTPAAIVELGFMTNENDLTMMLNEPDLLALGIANGIIRYLSST